MVMLVIVAARPRSRKSQAESTRASTCCWRCPAIRARLVRACVTRRSAAASGCARARRRRRDLSGSIATARCASAPRSSAIHVYSLIHDDLPAMDDDDMRRGKPTSHVAFGEATAILAGDCLHALAFEMLADAATPRRSVRPRRAGRATLRAPAGPTGMAGGQVMDLAAEGTPLRPADRLAAAADQDRRADRAAVEGARSWAACRRRAARACAAMLAIRPRLPDR